MNDVSCKPQLATVDCRTLSDWQFNMFDYYKDIRLKRIHNLVVHMKCGVYADKKKASATQLSMYI